MAYRMTPARRAALKKAQIASARKRKGRGKKRPGIKKRVSNLNKAYNKEYARKQRTLHKGKGSIYKNSMDQRHSRGAYSKNWRGRPIGKKEARLNKASHTYVMVINPVMTAAVVGDYRRGRKAGTIKKKSKKK